MRYMSDLEISKLIEGDYVQFRDGDYGIVLNRDKGLYRIKWWKTDGYLVYEITFDTPDIIRKVTKEEVLNSMMVASL